MVWIGVYFADNGMKRPSKCHSSCGSDSVRDVELHHQVFLSRRKKVTPVFDLGVRGLAPRPEEPVRFAARTQPKSHRRMKNQPRKPTPSQECTRFGPKCFVKWAMRNVPVFEEKTRPIIEASVASSFGTGSIHSKPLPHKKRWPGLQIKTFAPVWTAAVKI